MREAQLALARLMGDESLIVSLRSLVVGVPNRAELQTIAILGEHSEIEAKTSACIRQAARINDATRKLLPFQVHAAYVVPDSTLKIRSKQTSAGYLGTVLATCNRGEAQRRRCQQK